MKSSLRKKKKIRILDNTIYVTSAIELEEETIKRISEIFGSEYQLRTEVDPKVIGGIRIKHGVKLFDGTVTKHLNELRRKLYNL